MIRALPREELAFRWNEIKKYVDRAEEYGMGESTSFDLFLECMEGKAECWEASCNDTGLPLSFGIARVNFFQQQSHLQVITASGEGWDEYGPEALEYAEEYAKHIGCSHVTIWGRKGWERKLKPMGYEHAYTVLSKEV